MAAVDEWKLALLRQLDTTTWKTITQLTWTGDPAVHRQVQTRRMRGALAAFVQEGLVQTPTTHPAWRLTPTGAQTVGRLRLEAHPATAGLLLLDISLDARAAGVFDTLPVRATFALVGCFAAAQMAVLLAQTVCAAAQAEPPDPARAAWTFTVTHGTQTLDLVAVREPGALVIGLVAELAHGGATA